MKKAILELILAVAQVLAAIIVPLICESCYVWLQFSIFLKRNLNLETATYRRYWVRRSNSIQRALDRERNGREAQNLAASRNLYTSTF